MTNRKTSKYNEPNTRYCKYCGKECKNLNSLINHERLCSNNPDRREHPRGFKGKRPWNAGLTKDTDIRLKKMNETYKKNRSLGLHKSHSHPHSEEFKKRQSKKCFG